MRGLWLSGILIATGWLLFDPHPLAAWGPATHVALGEAVLNTLFLVPPAMRLIIQRYPVSFLYGSVAADISFGKKYVPEGRHSHNWAVGEEILSAAPSPALRAAAYGYLAHLAADTIAHNVFVPRKLFLTHTGQAHGHTYWEHRMDLQVGEKYLSRARRLVMDHDHSEADELFDSVLSRTVFSFRTNRRIFRGMIQVQDNDRWKQVFDRVLRNSKYYLPEERVETYLAFCFDYILDFMSNGPTSRPRALDPVGSLNLRIAKRLRRAGLAEGGAEDPEVLDALADRFFPLPRGPLIYWPKARAVGGAGLLSPPSGGRAGGIEPEGRGSPPLPQAEASD